MIQTDHVIPARRPDLVIINKKDTVDFDVLADRKVKIKENEKTNQYLDLAKEIKKLWNMKVMVIPTVIGALGIILKGFVKGIEELEIGR